MAAGELDRCAISKCTPWLRGLASHLAQPLRLQVVDGVVGVVAVGQMRHDRAQPDRLVGRRVAQCGQHRRGTRRRSTPLRLSPVSTLTVTLAVTPVSLAAASSSLQLPR